jgi:predicted RNA binding protein YcfA (HicA-like mRNA interferase family)
MPPLSSERPREVIRKLSRLGFVGPFGGGKHVFMRHPEKLVKSPVPV